MSKSDGGPAYPSSNNVSVGGFISGGHSGMSLRDYFAAKAMEGFCSGPSTSGRLMEDVVSESFRLADAMLAARDASK